MANPKMDVEVWRRRHRKRGEALRWLKGITAPPGTPGRQGDGVLLREQELPEDARFLVWDTTEDMQHAEFGLIAKGSMQISAIPDWARFGRLDRVILTAPGRLLSHLAEITRGESATDELPMPHVMSITGVWIGGVLADSISYRATESGIEWLLNAPASGVEYAVEYLYAPRYLALPQSYQTSPTDKNGVAMPIHYFLQREPDFN